MTTQWVPFVETTRDGLVESLHLGALAVATPQADVKWSLGDPDLRTFPRSSLKPFQLLPLIARGGVERFGFTPAEIAVMAASHSGEDIHVSAVCDILAKIDAAPTALDCGVQTPLSAEAAATLARSAEQPTALHNNCSGKHAGMLALARLLDAPLDGYLDPEHPAQRAIRACLVELLDLDAADLPVGIDGCSAPAYAVSLRAMARGFALLAAPDKAPPAWQTTLRTVANAMRAQPELVGGTSGRVDTELMRLRRGLVAKGGAEAYFCVGHPDGLGLALKVLDGDQAGRARPVASIAAVRRLGWIDQSDVDGPLSAYACRRITNWANRHTGDVRPAESLRRRPSGESANLP